MVSMKVAASPDSESDVEKVVFKDEKGKGTKRVKKEKKDPNQPKRNPSAYNLYFTENSVKLKAANPEMAQKDLMKMVGESYVTWVLLHGFFPPFVLILNLACLTHVTPFLFYFPCILAGRLLMSPQKPV